VKKQIKQMNTRFDVFTEVNIQVELFWIVTPCNVVVGYQHFRDQFCLVKMEAACASDTLSRYNTTLRQNPGEHCLKQMNS
jgi:hypothetical protein